MLRAHAVERVGQIAELIARVDADAVREVALLDALGADEQLVHGGRDRPREQRADRTSAAPWITNRRTPTSSDDQQDPLRPSCADCPATTPL